MLIRSYLEQRTFRVNIGPSLSSPQDAPAEVLQGSCIGPVLYNIYVSNFSLHCSMQKIKNAYSANWSVPPDMEADTEPGEVGERNRHQDSQTDGLQNHLEGKRTQGHTERLAKISGAAHRSKAHPLHHLSRTRCKYRHALNRLYPVLVNACAGVDLKPNIFRMVLRPIFTQSGTSWVTATAKYIRKIQAMQNICLRVILRSSRYTPIDQLHHAANILVVRDYAVSQASSGPGATPTSL